MVSEMMDQVLAYGGLRLTPDVTTDNCPELDLLIVPGGWGTRTEIMNNNLLKWIAAHAAKTRLTASVCPGSSLLGKAGLLDGHEATTHWRAFDFLRESAPKAKMREDVRFTLVEPIFTSAGFSAGIDLALRIVNHFFGIEITHPLLAKWNILIQRDHYFLNRGKSQNRVYLSKAFERA